MLHLSDFDYNLPLEKIAQSPADPRDSSKLLVLDRQTGKISDKVFRDLEQILEPGDVLVLNNTKVFPARIFGSMGNKTIELLLEKEVKIEPDAITFSALTKPGLKMGNIVTFGDTALKAECVGTHGYTRELKFNVGREQLFEFLSSHAHTPIPPYINENKLGEKELREKYQTVFAKTIGAMAAPTAGLHFTPELLEKLRSKGIEQAFVTLHVGLGTFLPVKTDNITEHEMHKESFEISQDTASMLNQAKAEGRRIIAVGTTSVRVLESSVAEGKVVPTVGNTGIFIYPPYKFQFVDALITNFHTPKSTLLMLISAFASTPNTKNEFTTFADSNIGKAYEHAMANGYRFYSFGDAMLIS